MTVRAPRAMTNCLEKVAECCCLSIGVGLRDFGGLGPDCNIPRSALQKPASIQLCRLSGLAWLGLLRLFIYYLLLSPFVRRLHCNLMHPKRALTVVHLLPHFHMERYTLLRGLVEWDQTPQSLTAA